MITGASCGFGEGAVRAFSDRGYRVWGTMRDVALVETGPLATNLRAAAPDPQLVVNSDLELADAAAGNRPARTAGGAST